MSSAERSPVLDLADIHAGHAPRVGPKMARLGQLARDGWRVPDGYAVTVDGLAGWLPPNVEAELARLARGGHTAAPRELVAARELIESQPLPSPLQQAIGDAHERLAARTGHGPALRVAVRSSAVGEDGASASFAGQYATYLGISGLPDVLRHVRKCWASGFSAHALEYLRRAGAGHHAGTVAGQQMAVGIMELVDARCAGVVFTVDPVSGDRGRLVVEANWGLGESVVSGGVTPDHWEVDRDSGQILMARVSVKRAWSGLDPVTGEVTLQPLPRELASQECLAAHEVRYLCRQALAVEDAAGGIPQDIEWAVARGTAFPGSVCLLQHRPVTTLATALEPAQEAPEAPAFDPVGYALRNVFKVPES
jgi:pyruvate, water dikinase